MNPSLLAELRALRVRQREERIPRQNQSAHESAGGRDVVAVSPDDPPDMSEAARVYVGAMDSLQVEVERLYDAFPLDPGMGPMCYITAEGQVLVDEWTWFGDGLRVAEEEAYMIFVVGARKTGVEALLDLIPSAPPGAIRIHERASRARRGLVRAPCSRRVQT